MTTLSERPPAVTLPLLTGAECERVNSTVREMRELWTQRVGQSNFYTLGAASYLDGPAGFHAYRERAAATNPAIREQFGWLLERVGATLQEVVGDTVRFYDDAAVPGFHIFEYDPEFERGSAHFDLQYAMIDWSPLGNIDSLSQLSYTLPMELPLSGGGLDTFNIFCDELESLSVEAKRAVCDANRAPTYHDYHPGLLFLHSGRQLHRIRAFRPEDNGERSRITMQGHLIRTERGWINYW